METGRTELLMLGGTSPSSQDSSHPSPSPQDEITIALKEISADESIILFVV